MVTPFIHRLFATNCIESYCMLPRFSWFLLNPVNAGNGRLNSNRARVGLVNRVVPSKPGAHAKNGFGTSSIAQAAAAAERHVTSRLERRRRLVVGRRSSPRCRGSGCQA